jgi:hypothetical protein
MLIKLEDWDGKTHYVNPDHVVRVFKVNDDRWNVELDVVVGDRPSWVHLNDEGLKKLTSLVEVWG